MQIYLWENFIERVRPQLRILVRHIENVHTKVGKDSAEEHVEEEDLTEDVDEVEELTEGELHEVVSVLSEKMFIM